MKNDSKTPQKPENQIIINLLQECDNKLENTFGKGIDFSTSIWIKTVMDHIQADLSAKAEQNERIKTFMDKSAGLPFSKSTFERYFSKRKKTGQLPHKPNLDMLNTLAIYSGYDFYEDYVRQHYATKSETKVTNPKVVSSSPKSARSSWWMALLGGTLVLGSIFKFFESLLTNPFLLIGLVLFMVLGIHRLILRLGLIPPLSAQQGHETLLRILQYGFWIAIVTVILGIGLQALRIVRNAPDQQKAKNLAINEIISNSYTLDERLVSIQFGIDGLKNDAFEGRMEDNRKNNTPDFAEELGNSYKAMMHETMISSIKESMLDRKLMTRAGHSFIDNFAKGQEAQSTFLYEYLNRIAAVEQATEVLFKNLEFKPSSQSETQYRKIVETYTHSLTQKSIGAHLAGIRVINELKAQKGTHWIDDKLQGLTLLVPQKLIPEGQILELEKEFLKESIISVRNKSKLLDEKTRERDSLMSELEAIYNNLINEDSTDNELQVFVKFANLRALGNQAAALNKLEEFRRRFASDYPPYHQWVDKAIQFTKKFWEIKVEGGVYVSSIGPKSELIKMDIKAGDILIKIEEDFIKDIEQLQSSLEKRKDQSTKTITYLRFDASNNYEFKTAQVKELVTDNNFFSI
ncbi:MAG: PDZ domain-containing protein [Bacteroidota bacterium]